MKLKFICVIYILFLAFEAQGQITINQNSTPKVGDQIIYCNSYYSIDISKTGPNYIWDFSKVIPTSLDTFKFLDPQKISPVYGATYSNDVALQLQNQNFSGMYAFLNASSTGFRQDGIGVKSPVTGLATSLVYSSPDLAYKFPMNYGDKDSCNFGVQTKISGIPVFIKGKRINIVDGWGKVITPYKTYDCLRIKSIVTELDSFPFYSSQNNRIEYKWISNDEHIPVFQSTLIINPTKDSSQNLLFRDTFHIVMNPSGPQISFDVKDTNVFINEKILFTDKTVGLTSWKWTILPTTYNFAPGSSDGSQNPEVIFNSPGIYSVSLYGTGPTGSNTLIRYHYINATHNTGINCEDFNNVLLNIYPNPATGGIIKIEGGVLRSSKCIRICLFNTLGNEVMSKAGSGSYEQILNMSGYPKGLYFIKIQADNNIIVREFVLN